MIAAHTVPIHENDALVIVAPNGEELHIPKELLSTLIDEAYLGQECSEEIAKDDQDQATLDRLNALVDALEWMGIRGGVADQEGGYEADRERRAMAGITPVRSVRDQAIDWDPDPFDSDNDRRADR